MFTKDCNARRRGRSESPSARIHKKIINDTNITGLRKLGKFLVEMKCEWRYQKKKVGQRKNKRRRG
jgi:hypothetical protein